MLLEETQFAAESDAVSHRPESRRSASLPRTEADRQSERGPSHEVRTFDLPASIWAGMAACYTIFLVGITLATGHDGFTLFMIVISALYMVMFFGTGKLLNSLGAQNRPNPAEEIFETWSGPLDYKAAAAQVLTVPFAFAIFGIVITIIRAVVL